MAPSISTAHSTQVIPGCHDLLADVTTFMLPSHPLDIVVKVFLFLFCFCLKSDFITCLNPLITFCCCQNWTKFLAWPSRPYMVWLCLLHSHLVPCTCRLLRLSVCMVLLPLAKDLLLTLFPVCIINFYSFLKAQLIEVSCWPSALVSCLFFFALVSFTRLQAAWVQGLPVASSLSYSN